MPPTRKFESPLANVVGAKLYFREAEYGYSGRSLFQFPQYDELKREDPEGSTSLLSQPMYMTCFLEVTWHRNGKGFLPNRAKSIGWCLVPVEHINDPFGPCAECELLNKGLDQQDQKQQHTEQDDSQKQLSVNGRRGFHDGRRKAQPVA